ncbi:MAG: hypothetical protein AUG46_05330 [Acidobacteria bacterium 13_1_20CM_3_58_11]|nr:MAG: hypothetical protein AUG46_05330 [Acidobacteria bacterium 13_1_20CM_3_58_11]
MGAGFALKIQRNSASESRKNRQRVAGKTHIAHQTVVPVINRSVDVNAPDYFLATIAVPLAERGYYVFPVNMVKSVLADDGLSDANLVHAGDPHRLGELFGADAVMYISIERWDAKYAVLATSVTVELTYNLKSTHTGQELWKNHQALCLWPFRLTNRSSASRVQASPQGRTMVSSVRILPTSRRCGLTS